MERKREDEEVTRSTSSSRFLLPPLSSEVKDKLRKYKNKERERERERNEVKRERLLLCVHEKYIKNIVKSLV